MNFLEKALSYNIKLNEKIVIPQNICSVKKASKYYKNYGMVTDKKYSGSDIADDGEICYDLGEHYTGYFSFSLVNHGDVSDSPVRLRITFAELPFDFSASESEGRGWLSYSWHQEEIINVDIVPGRVNMPRRYAARYIRIEILAMNRKMKLEVADVEFRVVTSANYDYRYISSDPKWQKISDVSVRTLRECMQTLYEDSPKRDRRLWMGDLRLHAIVNYCTYKDIKLFKKCMYLFAALTDDKGMIPACLYVQPNPMHGNISLYDYAMLFMVSLSEYYDFSGDRAMAEELFDIAYHQFRLFYKLLDDDGRVLPQKGWWCFVDWNWDKEETPKSLPMAAIASYCLRYAEKLALDLSKSDIAHEAREMRFRLCNAANRYFYNTKKGLYEEEGVVSWVANVFMILSDSISDKNGIELIKRLQSYPDAVEPVTPYVYHYILESYAKLGMTDDMTELMENYWGDMIRNGADTFWEAHRVDDPFFSPYDDSLLNSACHAWSCTPVYFIDKYL